MKSDDNDSDSIERKVSHKVKKRKPARNRTELIKRLRGRLQVKIVTVTVNFILNQNPHL